MGHFRSDSRNVSVGDTVVRVVTAVDVQRLKPTGDFVEDSSLIARAYPGWDYRSDLVVYYTVTPAGYRQSSFEYGLGTEREALPDDLVPPHLGVFDHAGTRRAQVPAALAQTLGGTTLVVATSGCNVDDDAELEWLVVISQPRDPARKSAPQSLRLYDRKHGTWTVHQEWQILEPVRTGPLEQRDVTGDGRPDFVYRCFLETEGHFWVDVRIFSRHEGLAPMLQPALFNPGASLGPLR